MNTFYQVTEWKKFLAYDWDPELFSAFLRKYQLTFDILMNKVGMAVNHDRNIERIVELGLARRDLQLAAQLKSANTSSELSTEQSGFEDPDEPAPTTAVAAERSPLPTSSHSSVATSQEATVTVADVHAPSER